MRTSLEKAPAVNVQTAWGCLTANLAVPGSGSMMAHRRISGIVQGTLAITGMALSAIFTVRFFAWYAANRLRLEESALEDPVGALLEYWQAIRWAIVGICLFGIGWLWALLTSLRVLRNARRAEVAGKPAPPKLC